MQLDYSTLAIDISRTEVKNMHYPPSTAFTLVLIDTYIATTSDWWHSCLPSRYFATDR